MRIERGLVHLADDERDHHLTPFGVRGADDARLPHGGMLEQHLLHFAGIDVGAAADHHVLGAVAQRQIPAVVERAQVAGVQPAARQRLRGRGGVVPIPGHDNVSATDDLADLVRCGPGAVLGQDRDLDAGAGRTDGAQDRVVPALVVVATQTRDGHRGLALPVDLGEDRAERGHRLFEALDVHGAAAVDDGAQVRRRAAAGVHEALHHGRRQEGRRAGMGRAQVEELLGVEGAGGRHHLPGAAQHVGRDVEPRTVRHRRGVHQRAAVVRVVDVGQVRDGHRGQVAVREHRALGAAGGAAGVEQPGQRGGVDVGGRQGGGVEPVPVRRGVEDLEVNVGVRRQFRADLGGGEHRCRGAVPEDLGHLARVQLEVERDEHAAGGPDAEHQFHDLGPVLAGHRDAGAGLGGSAQRGGQAQRPVAQFAPGRDAGLAEVERALVRIPGRGLVQHGENVHRGTHSELRAKSDRYLVELQPPSTTMV